MKSQEKNKIPAQQTNAMRIWNVLYPIGMYFLLTNAVLFFLDFVLPQTIEFRLLRQLITSLAVLPFLYYCYRQNPVSHEAFAKSPVFAEAFLTGGCFAIALNQVLGMLRIADYSASYGEITKTFYIGSLPLEIMALCIVIPLAEELLYRGIVYARFKDWLGKGPAMILSAVIFGLIHMNLVQFLYASIFGLLLAYLMEKSGSFWGAAAAHMAANLTSVLRTETKALSFLDQGPVVQLGISLLLFLAAAGGIYLIKRHTDQRK